ncbi:MAG: N-acetylmuramidase domain-containing protein [Bacteroidota bacterium]
MAKTEKNYGPKINALAKEFDLPSSYLKALIILEVGGRNPAPTRFEKGIYKKLKKLKNGEISRFEVLRKKTIRDASDEALKNLSTSWGAFQIMGYKCVQMGIKVSDIRGSKSLYWGVKWINDEYGKYLRKNKFKDAFHIHNTGRKYPNFGAPQTYHLDYVPNGLKYIEMFEKLQT